MIFNSAIEKRCVEHDFCCAVSSHCMSTVHHHIYCMVLEIQMTYIHVSIDAIELIYVYGVEKLVD